MKALAACQRQRISWQHSRLATMERNCATGAHAPPYLRLAMAAKFEVCFFDPRAPWQRGLNGNTNRLLRQHPPGDTDLSVHPQAKLSAVARQRKERPGKILQYQIPMEKYAECVAAID